MRLRDQPFPPTYAQRRELQRKNESLELERELQLQSRMLATNERFASQVLTSKTQEAWSEETSAQQTEKQRGEAETKRLQEKHDQEQDAQKLLQLEAKRKAKIEAREHQWQAKQLRAIHELQEQKVLKEKMLKARKEEEYERKAAATAAKRLEAAKKQACHEALEEQRQVGYERVSLSHQQHEQNYIAEILEYKRQKAGQEAYFKKLRVQLSQLIGLKKAAGRAQAKELQTKQAALNDHREKAIKEKERQAAQKELERWKQLRIDQKLEHCLQRSTPNPPSTPPATGPVDHHKVVETRRRENVEAAEMAEAHTAAQYNRRVADNQREERQRADKARSASIVQATGALEEQARLEYDTWMHGKSLEEKQHKRQANIQQRQDARLAKVLQHQRQVKQDIHAQREQMGASRNVHVKKHKTERQALARQQAKQTEQHATLDAIRNQKLTAKEEIWENSGKEWAQRVKGRDDEEW
eukprot:CAMPEP_0198209076 /NCGR_PEP_ID=MMETSP1445-20131203/12399_1 /TAXON_ID=36898 /ORGANISM="Pyramimonas sp., Strain CCMP2087" /LENGTH=469 /DNA_ID=CAMNT_0043882709 /DNA_START=85 /DNA_END=1494 /DNA_ORIENTATION=-